MYVFLTQTPFFSCIVTSDRDEKVRVTNYPATHEIEAFCVGHKEFVASTTFFNNDELLISASGDQTLRFWNFKTGKQVQLIDLSYVPVTLCLSGNFLAIASDDETIYIYKYETVSPEITKIHLLGEKKFSSEIEITGKGENFFITFSSEIDGKKKITIEKATVSSDSVSFKEICDVAAFFNHQLDLTQKPFKSFDVSLLFKKKFDNVKQYIDRKKARIETQAKKNKTQ